MAIKTDNPYLLLAQGELHARWGLRVCQLMGKNLDYMNQYWVLVDKGMDKQADKILEKWRRCEEEEIRVYNSEPEEIVWIGEGSKK